MATFGKCSGGGRRSAAREASPLLAILITVTRTHAAMLVDISETGARLRDHDLPKRGEIIELSIGNVRAFAIVKWVRGDECGVAFDEPLAAAEVKSLRRQVPKALRIPPELAAARDWALGVDR